MVMVPNKQLAESQLTVRPTVADDLTSLPPLVSKDNKYLICCCGCDIKVFSVNTGGNVHVLKGHQDLVTSVVFNPTNQFQIFSTSLDGTIRKWNFEDGVAISVTTPVCTEGVVSLVIHGLYSIPGDKKHFIYLVKTNHSDSQKGEYSFMKQDIHMEQWSTSDFVSHKMYEKRPKHVVIGGQGSYIATVVSPQSYDVISLSRPGKHYHHVVVYDPSLVRVQQCLSDITCLAAHPTEDCVAVGHLDGKINIWTNVASRKAIYTWVHWHALPVLSLKYTPEGSYLLSGGKESVLVKWPHSAYGNHGQREFLPRLGAPVSHITSSDDNSVYVTSHTDNSIKVVKNWIVVQVFQGLTRDYLSRGKAEFPAGVNFDPKSGAMVLNGLPGHLQFYMLSQDKLLYNLDIVGQNYTSGDSVEKQSNCTRIELVRFSRDGGWMVTVERWTGPYSEQCRMKFWYFNEESNSYVLNTDVDTPHQGPVASLQFSPPADEENSQSVMLVSVGATDRKFKLWKLNINPSEKANSGVCWRVESTGYYKNKNCSVADFSDDGSVLAVAFENTLTLWDPFENYLCTSVDLSNHVSQLNFCHGTQANILVIATRTDIILWDLLDYSEKQRWQVSGVRVVCIDPASHTIAAFTDSSGCIIDSGSKLTQFPLPVYANRISSAAFSTKKSASGECSVKRRLYVTTENGSVLVVDDKDVSESSDVTPTVEQASKMHIATNYQQVTPLANLLNSQLVKTDTSMQQVDSRTGLVASQIIKQIGETSCVAMPTINTLCRAFLNSLLLDKAADQTRAKEAEDSSESEMEVDSGSDTDEEVSVKNKKVPSLRIQNTNTEAMHKKLLKKSDIIDLSAVWLNT